MKNVVLVTVDAMRADALGRMTALGSLTPFLDSLVPRCMRWRQAQSTGPYTQAAFPGLLTSSYYLDYGEPDKLSPNRTLISEALRTNGICSAAFHSNPYLSDYMGWNRGWDIFYDSMEDEVNAQAPYILGGAINRKVDRWLSRWPSSGPNGRFFLWVHYMDLHEPYVPDRRFLDATCPEVQQTFEEMYSLFTNVLLKRDTSNPDSVALLKKLYDAHVCEVDAHIEELLGMLDAHGSLDDTAVIVTADHGDEFGEHGGLSHDDKMYSELIHVPLLLFGHSPGVVDYPVSTVGVAPTILDLMGVEPAAAFQGQSLLDGRGVAERACFGEALAQLRGNKVDLGRDTYFCRIGGLKAIHRAWTDEWEMYDLTSDPGELHNIADQSPEFQRMRDVLVPRVRRWARS